jgi:cytoskeletal protein CcmA (bactofilin family)
MAQSEIDTVIGAQVELKGSLHNEGPILIHGRIIGEVSSNANVLVGESAVITGPINAKGVEVSGQVIGNITALDLIELQPKSLVKGDLNCVVLSIKPGASFIGKSQMNSNETTPLKASEFKEDQPSLEEPTVKHKPRLEID